MKITKEELANIIKEEIEKALGGREQQITKEAGRPHSMRYGRKMSDLDKDAKTRETDFLKKKVKPDLLDPYNPETIPERQYIADEITDAAMKAVLDMASEKFNFEKEKVQHLELDIEEKLLDVALEIADIIIDARY